MPAEGPIPHGRILDLLRAALTELQTEAVNNPRDPILVPAIGHVGAAVALLEVSAKLEAQPTTG